MRPFPRSPAFERPTETIRPNGINVIPNHFSSTKDNKAGKGIARDRAVLEWLVWKTKIRR